MKDKMIRRTFTLLEARVLCINVDTRETWENTYRLVAKNLKNDEISAYIRENYLKENEFVAHVLSVETVKEIRVISAQAFYDSSEVYVPKEGEQVDEPQIFD